MKFRFLGIAAVLFACQHTTSTQPTPTAPLPRPSTPAEAPAVVLAPSASAASNLEVSASATTGAPKAPRNVLLLTVDSLRADMPWTTYQRPIAPNLDALAKSSVMYPNAYSISSYTAKSVSGLLAGRYPSSLYRSGWFFAGFPDANLFFPELIQKHGGRTLGLHGHLYFDRGKNLNQGFDEWALAPGLTFNATTDKHITSDKLTDAAIGMLSRAENASKQFFLWIHYMDPHDEYIKHPESPDFGKTGRDRYDSEVFFTDLHIGRLLKFAREQSFWENTCVIVTADHGETFGEHGMYKHGFELWEVLTYVPLIVYVPGAKPQVIDARRSAIDLAPTILDLMGIAQPSEFAGHSLVPELFGKEPDNREPIVMDIPEDKNSGQRRAIISGDYKLIVQNQGAKTLLFNLKNDPAELSDLSRKEGDKLAEMKALLQKTSAQIQEIEPYGGMKLPSGKVARGTEGPAPGASATTGAKSQNPVPSSAKP